MITLTLSCFYPLPGKWVFIQHLPNLTMQTPAKRCWQQIHILCKIVKLRRENPRKCVLQIRVKFCLLPAQYRKRSCCWTPASQTSPLTRNRRQLNYLYMCLQSSGRFRYAEPNLCDFNSWKQWCGSGSGRIRIHLDPWIRIWINRYKTKFNQKHFFVGNCIFLSLKLKK